jgi:signal transduction histidine kinase
MKKEFQSKRILYFMILSGILLTLFVANWMYTSYRDEKAQLSKDLDTQFSFARQQVIDSMLLNKLIDPILANEKSKLLSLHGTDSIRIEHKINLSHLNAQALPGGRTQYLIIHSDSETSTLKGNHPIPSPYDSGDLMLNGVKLIINEVRHSYGNGSATEKIIATSNADTLLLQKIFKHNLDRNGFLFPVLWTSHVDKIAGANAQEVIYIESRLFSKSYGAEITGYRLYLIRKMFPSLLFAFVLLLVTGMAFRFSWRSIQDQMRLGVLKDDLISNISHELKTPVSTIKLALEALQKTKPAQGPGKIREYLEMATVETGRLQLLISQVLEGSMEGGGPRPLFLEEIDLRDLLSRTLDSLSLRFLEAGATVHFDSEPGDYKVRLDKLHVQGVLLNLLDNSLKYAKEKPLILVSLSAEADEWVIKVDDNGPGIPKEYMENIFEKFFRVPQGLVHNVKGNGLGLNYSARVMKMHGGRIGVKNKPDKGCVFELAFKKH